MLGLQHGRSRHGRDTNLVAMLSLNLLLLAFFILLNALSNFEDDRTRAVIESVNEAFNGRVESLDSIKNHPAALDALQDAEALIHELQSLFDSLIPAVHTEIASDGPILKLEISPEALFRSGRTELQPGRDLLLNRVAKALLSDKNRSLYFEIEFLLGMPKEGGSVIAEAGARSLELRRLGAMAESLKRRGLPADRLSIGVVPGRPGIAQLVIRVYEQVPAPDSFEELAN